MALRVEDLVVITDLVHNGVQPPRVLSFGHPDILSTPSELFDIFGKDLPIDNTMVRAQRIGQSEEKCIGSAFVFFDALGAKFTALDHRHLFGITENFDFNYPIAERHFGQYTLVIDPGTIEHVMNVGEALISAARAACIGGYIYHISPMSMLNHGYWNFSPVTYHDFYLSNGFEIVRLEGRRKKGGSFEVPTISRFKENINSMIVCVAKKLREIDRVVWPIQGKYS